MLKYLYVTGLPLPSFFPSFLHEGYVVKSWLFVFFVVGSVVSIFYSFLTWYTGNQPLKANDIGGSTSYDSSNDRLLSQHNVAGRPSEEAHGDAYSPGSLFWSLKEDGVAMPQNANGIGEPQRPRSSTDVCHDLISSTSGQQHRFVKDLDDAGVKGVHRIKLDASVQWKDRLTCMGHLTELSNSRNGPSHPHTEHPAESRRDNPHCHLQKEASSTTGTANSDSQGIKDMKTVSPWSTPCPVGEPQRHSKIHGLPSTKSQRSIVKTASGGSRSGVKGCTVIWSPSENIWHTDSDDSNDGVDPRTPITPKLSCRAVTPQSQLPCRLTPQRHNLGKGPLPPKQNMFLWNVSRSPYSLGQPATKPSVVSKRRFRQKGKLESSNMAQLCSSYTDLDSAQRRGLSSTFQHGVRRPLQRRDFKAYPGNSRGPVQQKDPLPCSWASNGAPSSFSPQQLLRRRLLASRPQVYPGPRIDRLPQQEKRATPNRRRHWHLNLAQ